MPPAVPILFCQPSDVYDDLGTDGVDLRLADPGPGTGQTVTVRANAAQGATSLSIQALTAPLLAGSTLQFDGGGMPAITQVQLSTVGQVGDTALTVAALPNAVNATAFALDNGNNVALAQRLLLGCQDGTAQVMLWCCGKYDPAQLVRSFNVFRWARALAKRWVTRRRGLNAPASVGFDAEQAIEEMKLVQSGKLKIDTAGTRTSAWPFITNAHIDLSYDYNRIRIEPYLSEGTPVNYPQYIDWSSIMYIEW